MKKRGLLRKGVRLAGVLGTSTAAVLVSPPGAHAATSATVIAGGSDTTQDAMTQFMAEQNGAAITYNGTQYNISTYNIPALPGAAGFNTPAHTYCPATTWTADSTPATPAYPPNRGRAPFGSGAGRDYIGQFEELTGTVPIGEKGCIGVARSSSGKRTIGVGSGFDTAGMHYYAYALDAVSWASTSLKAPPKLTLSQIQGIYNCTITNWNQVGGGDGPIVPYLPQTGSGTRSFFIGAFLGGTTPATSCVPTSRYIEENEMKSVVAADIDRAIMPYSAALWDFQESNKTNPTLDKRNGAKLGGYVTGAATPVTGNPAQWVAGDNQYELATPALESFLANPASYAVVSENNEKAANPAFSSATDYVGIRYVYNVVNANLPTDVWQPAHALVGFDNVASGFKSPMCNGSGAGAIQTAGLATLDNSNPNSLNAAGSTCRKTI